MSYVIYDDYHLIPYYIIVVVCAFAVLGISVIAHELGHYYFFKFKKNKEIKIKRTGLKWLAGTMGDYAALSKREYMAVNTWGFIAGIIPIIIAGFIFAPFYLMIFPYGWGCRQDIGEIIKNLDLED